MSFAMAAKKPKAARPLITVNKASNDTDYDANG
jgi:hypothetical protein